MQRFSQQRERIYEAVRTSMEHPTAQMVYDALRPEMPRLSLGTVYRNLHQMAQEGRLRELEGPVARFDAVLPPHAHIRCVRCGQVADLALPYDPALDREAVPRLNRGSSCRSTSYTIWAEGCSIEARTAS